MRILVLLSLLGATCIAAPAGVDGLKPDDVTKALAALKENYVRPQALSDSELGRATLQGLLDRLEPGVSLVTGSASVQGASPFYSELCNGNTGYLRVGELTLADIEKAKQTLKEWTGGQVPAVVLDLRATPPSNQFIRGETLAGLFCAEGTQLFGLLNERLESGQKTTPIAGSQLGTPATGPSSATSKVWFNATGSPLFKGIVVVLVDGDTAEAPEAVAACLQKCAKALVVGDKTAGRAFEYRDFPLDGALLRIAVARVILPDGKEPGENGLTPDIAVPLGAPRKSDVMRSIAAKGVSSVISERDRPHLTEAALVARSNPEVDAMEAEQTGKAPSEPIIDRQLQRALDLVTSISIYHSKADAK